jgi:hypothetical protein
MRCADDYETTNALGSDGAESECNHSTVRRADDSPGRLDAGRIERADERERLIVGSERVSVASFASIVDAQYPETIGIDCPARPAELFPPSRAWIGRAARHVT